jgi:hypothetical protein
MISQPPYPEPEPRTFQEWLQSLGLSYESSTPPPIGIITYLEFCFPPGLESTIHGWRDYRLVRSSPGELYGFWRQYGDVWGEPRTVRDWFADLKLEVVDATPEDEADMELFLGYDEFCAWAGGKVTDLSLLENQGLGRS